MHKIEIKNNLLRYIREFFYAEDFFEVETPIILKSPCIEEYINAINCGKYYLRTSPELFHKKILSKGYQKIFEIGKCFREGEIGDFHNPEYTILEWYRVNSSYKTMLDETYNLIIFLLNKLSKSLPIKRIFSVRDIFMELDNWDPIDSYHAKRFDEVLVNKIEPYFKKLGGIIFLKDYPVEACALAKISGDKQKIAERWELYLDGLEIANAYSELTDPEEQRKRFISCQNKRLHAGQLAYEIDEEFIQSLNDINEAGGCALGVDRLLAWICNEDNIDNFVYRDIFK